MVQSNDVKKGSASPKPDFSRFLDKCPSQDEENTSCMGGEIEPFGGLAENANYKTTKGTDDT